MARWRLGLTVLIGGVLSMLAPAASHAIGYVNPAKITIAAQGGATPSPSTISPSVDPSANLVVASITVTLNGYWHGRPRDVDVYLVSPAGKAVMLMSDAGGTAAIAFGNRKTVTFNDAAPGPVPPNGAPGNGSFKPTDNEPGDGPAGYTTSLASFKGTSHRRCLEALRERRHRGHGRRDRERLAHGHRIDRRRRRRSERPASVRGRRRLPGRGEKPPATLIKPGGSLTIAKLFDQGGIRVKVKVKKSGSTVSGRLVKRTKRGAKPPKKPFVFAKGKARRVPKGTYTLLLKPTRKSRSKLTKALKKSTRVKLSAKLKVDPPGRGKVTAKTVKLSVKR